MVMVDHVAASLLSLISHAGSFLFRLCAFLISKVALGGGMYLVPSWYQYLLYKKIH
jgi:hypothetical protein